VVTLEGLLEKKSYHNSPALVMGSSPTVKSISRFPFNGIKIGVGDMPVRAPELGPYDYWVCANTYYPLIWDQRHFKDIVNSGATTLIATMSVQHSKASEREKLNAFSQLNDGESIVLYDQRHFLGQSCNPPQLCCKIYQEFSLSNSIQELLSQLAGRHEPTYSEGATVAVHGYALAVLLGANPIYIAGVDLPATSKAYRAYKHWFLPHEGKLRMLLRRTRDFFDNGEKLSDFGNAGLDQILLDFKKIAAVARSLNIETYCLSELSPLNNIVGIKYLDPN
jgi:hypothetical protein